METRTITPEQAERLRTTQGFKESWSPAVISFHGCAPPPKEVSMLSRMKDKALDLLRDWVEQLYESRPISETKAKIVVQANDDETDWERTEDILAGLTVERTRIKPDSTCSTELEFAQYEAQLRRDMARELWKMHKGVLRKVTRDGSDLSFRTSVAVLELRKLINHSACRRATLCDKCATKARDEGERMPLACRCPSALQRWGWRLLRQVETQPYLYRWQIAYVLLIFRGVVAHWQENRTGIENPKAGRRESAMDRTKHRVEVWRTVTDVTEDADGNEVRTEREELVTASDVDTSDGTSRMALDLRGWDRPTSMGRRTQRLAFCPECAMREDPWFLVGRKVEFGKAKCHKQVEGKECGTTEVPPPPRSGKIPTYTVKRKRKAHGKELIIEHKFYRKQGRWTAERTNEQVHLMLHHQLERRWLASLKARNA